VSRIHCELEIDAGRVMVHDSESASGTFVNCRRITRHELRCGDVVRVGETELLFEDDDAEAPTRPPQTKPNEVVFASKRGAPVVPPVLQRLVDLVGQSVGRFNLVEVLGVGQVGVVFRAIDPETQGSVALKVFKPEIAHDSPAMRRLVRGLMASRSLTHPHLVTLYAAGKASPYWWVSPPGH
jgi:hypothetical protein